MFGKKEQSKQSPRGEYQIKPAPPLQTNLPRANMTTWPQQWEYKWMLLTVVQIADPSEILATLGVEGWELVAVYPTELPVIGKARELYFKRPKTNDSTQTT